jgi:hypothetical protein
VLESWLDTSSDRAYYMDGGAAEIFAGACREM